MMRCPAVLLVSAAIRAVLAQASPVDPKVSLANSTDPESAVPPAVLAGNGTNTSRVRGGLRGSGLDRAGTPLTTLTYEGDVSLCGSSSAAAGLLLVRHSGAWGTVCDDDFGEVNAQVVCRQLGYPLGRLYSGGLSCEGSSYDILMDEVTCSGSENRLEDCTHAAWGVNDCSHGEDVSIFCYSTALWGEGYTDNEGRLAVYHAGEWGTVCDDSFDDSDAEVACRQLGFSSGRVIDASAFGEISGHPILMDDLECTGSESRLEQCTHGGWGEHNCGHSEDVAIRCGSTLRLAGEGATANQGRLEVLHAGEWGTVCDDDFDNSDAGVACRQLGYSNGVAVGISNFGAGSGQIWMDQVACAGTEGYLEDCGRNSWGEHNCGHSEDVGVMCYS